ncbi:MAG: hypothetical protein ACD_28C00005G0008 [uncultured bacterium]|nr:MAG: hypothetical protein ACD_28C00005G0008 [uncultured bacterium]KKT75692.1 MAG: hypothetical protein UW70_C0030G0011 [Candidatus Peregrinibacteria bacterium GW2011_GWA2_44_7]
MKARLKKIIAVGLLGMMLIPFGVAITPVFAQESTGTESEGKSIPTIPKPELLPGPGKDQTQEEVQNYFRNEAIPRFINGFLGLVAGFSLLALIISGIRFVIAYGEEEGITEAKKTATWAVIGFVISLFAYAIVGMINTIAFPQGEDNSYTKENQEEIQYNDL